MEKGVFKSSVPLPRLAYILLWFPKASETFIFQEVVDLWKLGLWLKVFTLYGPLPQDLSMKMQSVASQAERLGLPYLKSALQDVFYWWVKRPSTTRWIFKTALFCRGRSPERQGESLWGALCGCRLARRFLEERITHIHAPWACGPATAAWVASHLSGIPFSFTGRAHDVFTPDGLLPEKVRDAALVRCESRAVMRRLLALTGEKNSKFRLTYNAVPLADSGPAPVPMQPPYQLLALGRLVGTKGFDFLIHACKILQESGGDFYLTLAGDGPQGRRLKDLARKLGLAQQISFPGFIAYDRVAELFRRADIFIMPCAVLADGNRDGLPTVILEALLHRLPVIATDVAGIGEVIESGVTGLLIPQKDPQALAAAVWQLVRDREAALQMAERGRRRVQQDFSPETNHRLVSELFRQTGADRQSDN
jgi:glycosyltransferase involved in cell wall biosynthesis